MRIPYPLCCCFSTKQKVNRKKQGAVINNSPVDSAVARAQNGYRYPCFQLPVVES